MKYYHVDNKLFINHDKRTVHTVYYLDNRDNWICIHNVKYSEFNIKINNLVVHYALVIPLYRQYNIFNNFERHDYIDIISKDVNEFVSYLMK